MEKDHCPLKGLARQEGYVGIYHDCAKCDASVKYAREINCPNHPGRWDEKEVRERIHRRHGLKYESETPELKEKKPKRSKIRRHFSGGDD